MKRSVLLLTGAALTALGACGVSSGRTPNEFRIVTKPELQVPPEYNLRPPPTGSSIPQEVAQGRTDQTVTFGQQLGQDASASERILVNRAGALSVSPVIRSVVDYEETGVLRKSQDTVNRVITFKDGEQPTEDSATGGAQVRIDSSKAKPVKLPGT